MSKTMRTARSRSSSGYFFGVGMTPHPSRYQGLQPTRGGSLLAAEPELVAARPRQTLIGDKNYFGRDFEHRLAGQSIRLLRLARKGEPQQAGAPLFKPLRQVIESV